MVTCTVVQSEPLVARRFGALPHHLSYRLSAYLSFLGGMMGKAQH
jgi:hypothetical protein